ncbi:MAG: hypothetical protein MJ180_03470, partial [Candidatus Gastranaerophilales bacterium]|nr:hypothetical protein [Candidatus Gastranaerophilales bacterium]
YINSYSLVCSFISFSFMFLCAVFLFVFNEQIVGLYTSDVRLAEIIIPIIYIAAVYQVFDGLQIAFSGILKGLKKTKLVTVAILCGYWLFGLPLGGFLAYKFKMELMGFWVGLGVAIFIMGVFMGTALYFMFQKLRKEYTTV